MGCSPRHRYVPLQDFGRNVPSPRSATRRLRSTASHPDVRSSSKNSGHALPFCVRRLVAALASPVALAAMLITVSPCVMLAQESGKITARSWAPSPVLVSPTSGSRLWEQRQERRAEQMADTSFALRPLRDRSLVVHRHCGRREDAVVH